jgi:flagellar basal body-associated protein FliL
MSLLEAIVVLVVVLALAVGVYMLLFGRSRCQQTIEAEKDWVIEKQLDPDSPSRDPER